MAPTDPFDLPRFVSAQEDVYTSALAELIAGRKRSHWMWFVFPQLRGLGSSSTAVFYGLTGLAEAQAYLAHPVLGSRLAACTDAMLSHEGKSLRAVLGTPDDLKFRSSMTLFTAAAAAAAETGSRYAQAIERLCGGQADDRSLALLAG